MGLIDCPKHGLKGIFYGISDDIIDAIYTCKPVHNHHIVHITSVFDTDLNGLYKYIISKQLFDALELKETIITTKEQADEIYDLLTCYVGPVCITCLKEFITTNQLYLII